MSKKLIPGLKNVVVTEAGRLETGGGLGIGSLDKVIELHPLYAGGLWWQDDYRGTDTGEHYNLTLAESEETVANVLRHYYEASSSEANDLQDKIVSALVTLPSDFKAWATSNAIQIEYKTENGSTLNNGVDIHIFKSGTATEIANNQNNANTSWSTITIDDSDLGSWSANDVMEIFLRLETRSNYFARVGKITLNYTT